MINTVYFLNDDSSFKSLYLMDYEHIQKSFVITTDKYMENVFPEVGIIPNACLYVDTEPEVFKGSSVSLMQYDGSLKNAIEKISRMFLYDEAIHIRVLGTDSIKELVAEPNFKDLMKQWTSDDRGISLIYDGNVEVPDPIFPIWECRVKDKELNQVIPSFGKQVLTFGKAILKEAGSFFNGSDEVTEDEYLRRWNTCLSCPKLVRDEKKGNQLCCGVCGCVMKTKAHWRSAGCGDEDNPKW